MSISRPFSKDTSIPVRDGPCAGQPLAPVYDQLDDKEAGQADITFSLPELKHKNLFLYLKKNGGLCFNFLVGWKEFPVGLRLDSTEGTLEKYV